MFTLAVDAKKDLTVPKTVHSHFDKNTCVELVAG